MAIWFKGKLWGIDENFDPDSLIGEPDIADPDYCYFIRTKRSQFFNLIDEHGKILYFRVNLKNKNVESIYKDGLSEELTYLCQRDADIYVKQGEWMQIGINKIERLFGKL